MGEVSLHTRSEEHCKGKALQHYFYNRISTDVHKGFLEDLPCAAVEQLNVGFVAVWVATAVLGASINFEL